MTVFPKDVLPTSFFQASNVFFSRALNMKSSNRRNVPVTSLCHYPHPPLLFVLLLFQADPRRHRPKEQEGGLFLPDAARQDRKGQQQQVGVSRASSASLPYIFFKRKTLYTNSGLSCTEKSFNCQLTECLKITDHSILDLPRAGRVTPTERGRTAPSSEEEAK